MRQENTDILGLDISTSVVGISVINMAGDLIHYSHVTLNKVKRKEPEYESIWKKGNKIYETLLEINAQFDIGYVFIEAPAEGGFGGMTNAKTMAILQSFNGIVSWQTELIFGVSPIHLAVRSMRKKAGIKQLGSRGKSKKEKQRVKKQNKIFVNEFFQDLYENFEVVITAKGNIRAQCLDESDAILVSYVGWMDIKEGKYK